MRSGIAVKYLTCAACISLLLTVPATANSGQEPADPVAASQALYDEGVALYQVSDYAAAVEKFQAAFAATAGIEDSEQGHSIQVVLWFNLARAQYRAYEIDHQEARLRQAKDLFGKFIDATSNEADRAEAQALLAEVRAALGERTEDPEDSTPAPAVSKGASDGGSAADGRGMRITGYALLGLGVGTAAGLTLGGAVSSARAQDAWESASTGDDLTEARSRGRTGNSLMVAGAAVGGSLVVTGLVLTILGHKKKGRGSVAAGVGPGAFRVAVGGRF